MRDESRSKRSAESVSQLSTTHSQLSPSLHQLLQRRLHCLGPELVAGGVGVQLVGHEDGRNLSVVAEESLANVEVADVVATVIEFRELHIHLADDGHLA